MEFSTSYAYINKKLRGQSIVNSSYEKHWEAYEIWYTKRMTTYKTNS